MRTITRIFVHCTASWQESTTVESLKEEFRRKGWENPGYHWVVFPDGKVVSLLAECYIANGVKGYNSKSVHVAWVGGIKHYEYWEDDGLHTDRTRLVSIDNRTSNQKLALFDLLVKIKLRYRDAMIIGHRDISPDLNHNGIIDPWERIKDCPCFDAMDEYMDINKIG